MRALEKLLLAGLLILGALPAFAEAAPAPADSIEISFAVSVPQESGLGAEQRKAIREKLERVLARTGAAAEGGQTPFVVVPSISAVSTSSTDGLTRNRTLVEGELVLLVRNRHDGTLYNEMSVSLREVVDISNPDSPTDILIKAINPKDRRFTRFIRVSRERITERYEGKVLEIP